MKVSAIRPPPCGLYRTTRPLPDAPEIEANLLVNLHSCERAVHGPELHLPKFSAFNRWEWCREGHVIAPLTWVETLVALKPEGFYLLREKLRLEDAVWPALSLVQLGYDRAGTPIAFLAQRRHQLAENTLFFADKGMPVPDLDLLEAIVVHEEPDPNVAGGEAPHAA